MPYNGGYHRNGRKRGGFKRGRGRGRTMNRGRGYQGNKFNYYDVFEKVVRDVGRLKSLVNTEFKAKDIANDIAPTTTMNITLLNGLSKGDDLNDRDGRLVRWKSVWIKQCMTINPATINTFVRILVIIDKQPNATLLTVGEILSASTVESQRSLDSRKRLIFLKDQVYVLTQDSGTAIFDNWYKDIDMKTVYDASDNGDISDIETNALYLCTITNEAVLAPTIGRFIRTRFIDN